MLLLLNIKIFLVKFQFAIDVFNVRVFKVALRYIHTGLWCTIQRVNPNTKHFWPKYDNSLFLILYNEPTNKRKLEDINQ